MAMPPLDPQQRKNVILGAVLLAIVAYFGYDMLYSPRAAEAVSSARSSRRFRRPTSAPAPSRTAAAPTPSRSAWACTGGSSSWWKG
jgi:hypothetical protein